jgi:hypothetical protein
VWTKLALAALEALAMSRTSLVVLVAGAAVLAAVVAPASSVDVPPPVAVDAAAGTRLVIIGGGTRPPEALARFVTWAGGSSARILVLPWASGEPKESGEAILGELRLHAVVPGWASSRA